MQLMRNLQKELGMAIMFITHNLGVVAQMTEAVIVMYMGRVVERATVDQLFFDAKHPYTRALLESIPKMGAKSSGYTGKLASIKGTVPDPFAVPKGCPYHPRCAAFMPGICDVQDPPVIVLDEDHDVRCHLYAPAATGNVIPLVAAGG